MELSKKHFIQQWKFNNHFFGANQRKMLIQFFQDIKACVDENQLTWWIEEKWLFDFYGELIWEEPNAWLTLIVTRTDLLS